MVKALIKLITVKSGYSDTIRSVRASRSGYRYNQDIGYTKVGFWCDACFWNQLTLNDIPNYLFQVRL